MASTTQLSPESVSYLKGKQVSWVGSNYIVLDNGFRIYVSEDEIEHINEWAQRAHESVSVITS